MFFIWMHCITCSRLLCDVLTINIVPMYNEIKCVNVNVKKYMCIKYMYLTLILKSSLYVMYFSCWFYKDTRN